MYLVKGFIKVFMLELYSVTPHAHSLSRHDVSFNIMFWVPAAAIDSFAGSTHLYYNCPSGECSQQQQHDTPIQDTPGYRLHSVLVSDQWELFSFGSLLAIETLTEGSLTKIELWDSHMGEQWNENNLMFPRDQQLIRTNQRKCIIYPIGNRNGDITGCWGHVGWSHHVIPSIENGID